MRKILHKIHLWLSIPLGGIITVICLSGAILVFQDEINEMVHSERYFAKKAEGEPIPIGKLVEMINSKLENNSVVSVQVPSDSRRNYPMGLKEGSRAFVYVDPYTAEITGKTQRGEGFFSTVQRLHRWLLGDRNSIGKQIVGYTTVLFVFILISGIVVWLPKNKKQLKKRLQIKTKYGKKRFWTDLHASGGIYLVIGLLVLSLTGLYYSFDWYRKGLFGILGIEMTDPHNQRQQGGGRQEGGRPPRGEERPSSGNRNRAEAKADTTRGQQMAGRDGRQSRAGKPESPDDAFGKKTEDMSHWQSVVDGLKEKNPDFRAITVQNGTASVAQDFIFGNVRASDRYTFDNETGKITKTLLYKDQDKAVKVRGWIYTLHVGAWGGLFSKILTFIIAFVGASLPVTGYYMYYLKHKKKKRKKK